MRDCHMHYKHPHSLLKAKENSNVLFLAVTLKNVKDTVL